MVTVYLYSNLLATMDDRSRPAPISPDFDRFYILDEEARPVRVYDYGVEARWACIEGRRYRLHDRLPEHNAEVRTYFSGWASKHSDTPPKFWTHLKAGAIDKVFESTTWQEAQEKHRRVIQKVRRAIPRKT